MKSRIFSILFVLIVLFVSMMPISAQEISESFPVTIEHQYGSTTISEVPQRVVAIGYTEQDFLLAVGVTPVAVRYWYGDEADAIFPWADDKVEGDAPIVLNMPFGTLNYEAILALEPDLISAVTAGISQEEYDTLSQIAPTITQTDEYIAFGIPWQEVMQMVGDAVGKGAEAASIVAETEAQFADAIAQNPEFEGKTIAVAYAYDGTYGFYTPEDSRGRFFTDLGFVIPDELIEMTGDSFYTDISAERIDLLDQDLIAIVNLQFIEGGREALESDPLFAQLKAVQEGRVVYLDPQSENALGFSSPLSLAYALEATVPQLESIFSDSTADAVCGEGFWHLSHDLGETCIPDDAETIVSLDWSLTEHVLALGVQPLGVADIAGYKNWVDIPTALADDVADVGTRQEPNLEQIAELAPDLIVASSSRVTENYDELSAIAPTIVINAYPPDGASQYDEMLTTFNTIATALNREAEAREVLNDLQAKYDLATSALADAELFNNQFILAQSFLSSDSPTFRLFTNNAMAVQVLEKIGLDNAWEDVPQQYGYTTVDFEGFSTIGDVHFFYTAQPEDNTLITSAPVWAVLPFVQSESAYWLGNDVWLFGGPLSAAKLVDTIMTSLGIELESASTMAVTCEDGLRAVEDAVGTALCLPEHPERVISLTDGDSDALIALGVDPVGISNGRGSQTPPRYLIDYLPEDYVSVGAFYQPNLEIVLGLEPDLILFSYGDYAEPELIEQLNAIAPVYFTVAGDGTWQDLFYGVGNAMNMEADVEAYFDGYNSRVTELSQFVEADTQFIVARWAAEGPQVMAPYIFAPAILQEIGMVMPEEIPDLEAGHAHSAPLSLETVDILDSDWAFVGTLQSEGDAAEALQAVFDNPLFQQLEVVQNDHVVIVDGSIWTSSGGPLAANVVFDVIENILVGD